MSAFVPRDPSPTDLTVTNLEFWPELTTLALRQGYGIGSEVSDELSKEAIRHGMVLANTLLETWKATQEAAGYATIADVPSDQYGAATLLEIQYLHAVYSRAAARINDQLRSYATTKDGAEKAAAREAKADDHLAQFHRAIRAIQGLPGDTVELI